VANEPFIPVCAPLLAGRELDYVSEAVESGWISSSGSYVGRFEEAFAAYCGVTHAVTTNTGTAALHLACAAAGIGPGDEVIIPDFTMIATALAVCYCGARPVFVDCRREDWNIDASRIEEKITGHTRAIMPVHIYGHPCDMGAINDMASGHGLLVIEDAAEAHGAEYRGVRCGALGTLGCFSFFANKMITTGEGGMVVTNDTALAERCRYLKNMAFPLDGPRDYRHVDIGFNYRMSNVIAAIGLAQTERADDYLAMRRRNAALYAERLQGIGGITLQPEAPWAKNARWMYGILIEDAFGLERDAVMAALKERGIDSRAFFTPMHRQPCLAAYGCDCQDAYPVADEISARGLYLPSGSGLEEAQIDYICDVLHQLSAAA